MKVEIFYEIEGVEDSAVFEGTVEEIQEQWRKFATAHALKDADDKYPWSREVTP